MNIYEKETVSIDLLFPTLCINKRTQEFVGEFGETKIDLSTKFVLTDYKKCVIMELRILGFGFKIYYYFGKEVNEKKVD